MGVDELVEHLAALGRAAYALGAAPARGTRRSYRDRLKAVVSAAALLADADGHKECDRAYDDLEDAVRDVLAIAAPPGDLDGAAGRVIAGISEGD